MISSSGLGLQINSKPLFPYLSAFSSLEILSKAQPINPIYDKIDAILAD